MIMQNVSINFLIPGLSNFLNQVKKIIVNSEMW